MNALLIACEEAASSSENYATAIIAVAGFGFMGFFFWLLARR